MSCRVSRITFNPPLPLAMYRELAVHLAQVKGLSTKLQPQNQTSFSYEASQIAGIELIYDHELDYELSTHTLIRAILDHYGNWHEQLQEQLRPFEPVETVN